MAIARRPLDLAYPERTLSRANSTAALRRRKAFSALFSSRRTASGSWSKTLVCPPPLGGLADDTQPPGERVGHLLDLHERLAGRTDPAAPAPLPLVRTSRLDRGLKIGLGPV